MWNYRPFVILLILMSFNANAQTIEDLSSVGMLSSSQSSVSGGLNLSLLKISPIIQSSPLDDILVFKSRLFPGQISGVNSLLDEIRISYPISEQEQDQLIIKRYPESFIGIELRRLIQSNSSRQLIGLDFSVNQEAIIEARERGTGMATGRRGPEGICGNYGLCIIGKANLKLNNLINRFFQKHLGKIAKFEIIAKSNNNVPFFQGEKAIMTVNLGKSGSTDLREIINVEFLELVLQSASSSIQNPLYKGNGTVKVNPLYER